MWTVYYSVYYRNNIMLRKRKVQFPCSVCEKAAGCGTIQCDLCSMWVHKHCVQLTSKQFADCTNSEHYFLCVAYVRGGTEDFDYERSLAWYVLQDNIGFWKAWRKRFCMQNAKPAGILNGKTGDENVRHEFTKHYENIYKSPECRSKQHLNAK